MTGVRVAAVTVLAGLLAASTAHAVVTIRCDAASASPGGVATVQIVLDRGADDPVAGTQNDLQFDPAVFSPDAAACLLNPAIVTKGLDTSVVSGGTAVRAIVVALNSGTNILIPAGNLYTCPFHVANDAALGLHTIVNANQIASGPTGMRLDVTGTDCMVSIVPTPTPTPRCRVDMDCPAGEVCVDGTCVVATPTPTPIGFCNTDHDCPQGEVCVDHRCVTPTPTATPIGYCTIDDDCPAGEVCVNNHCVTPTPTPQCRQDADCPTGQVCVNGTCATPTPKKGGGSSGCNCDIDPSVPASRASDLLAVLLPALVLLLRWRARRPSR